MVVMVCDGGVEVVASVQKTRAQPASLAATKVDLAFSLVLESFLLLATHLLHAQPHISTKVKVTISCQLFFFRTTRTETGGDGRLGGSRVMVWETFVWCLIRSFEHKFPHFS